MVLIKETFGIETHFDNVPDKKYKEKYMLFSS